MYPPTVLIALATTIFAGFVFLSARKNRHFPPGPKGIPIVGNIFDVPLYAAHKVFAKWGWNNYGKNSIFIVSLSLSKV